MPKYVEVPSFGTIEFPDNMMDDQINAVIQSQALPVAPGWRWPGANPYQTPLTADQEFQFSQWVDNARQKFVDPDNKPRFSPWVNQLRQQYGDGPQLKQILDANAMLQPIAKWQDTPTSDYDLRGYWQDIASQQQQQQSTVTGELKSDGGHLTDTYKTPYHHSFSGESQYSASDGPAWQGSDAAGWRLVDKYGNVVYDESNVKVLGPQQQ
jgi:hypothetical protein